MSNDSDGVIDGESLIAHHYPKDGPHNADRIASSSEAISQLFLYLNYATSSGQRALPFASNGYRLLSNLSNAAGRQEQLYQQLARWAEQLAADPLLRHYEHREADEGVNRNAAIMQAEFAANAFRTAADQVAELAATLAAAHNALAPLEHIEN